MYYTKIKKKISTKKAKVCIVGLGYVGYPLLQLLKKNKFNCVGIDSNQKKIHKLNKDNNYSKNFSTNYKLISESDIIIYALPTPLTKKNNPNLKILKDSIRKSANFYKNGQLIILESTSYPGTTRECLDKIIKKFKIGKNLFIGYSPERIDPGNKQFNIENITKISSGYSNFCQILTYKFYKTICKKVVKASTMEAAEFAKIYENIFRSVNIGLANETKQISKKLKIDFKEVLNLAETKPFGFMKFTPGPGVGGHCIPVDPFYLSWLAKKNKIKTKFIELSGKINSNMPVIICKEIKKYLIKKIKKKNIKILILGLSYKKNIDDIRNSPSLKILLKLKKFFSKVEFEDKYIGKYKIKNKLLKSINLKNYDLIENYDAIILATDHDYYNYNLIQKKSRLIFDLKNKFSKSSKVINL